MTHRFACSVLLLAIAGLAPARISLSQNSAPSSHLVFDDRGPGDIIVNEVRVPRSGRAMYTYYEALGWRGKGAGYAGIQVHPRAHNFIFSIWDHKEHKAPIRALHRGPGTETKPFGGEGTGLKSWNFLLGWETDVWYSLVARTWPHDDKSTNFGFWTRAGDSGRWTHLVTMNVAAPKASFEGATDAFIEDWVSTGEKPRTTNLRRGWKRTLDGKWRPFASGRYSVNAWDLDPGKRSFNYRTNWDGGVAEDETGKFYFMTAGGKKTRPTAKNPSKHAIARTEKEPQYAVMRIEELAATQTADKLELTWRNDAKSAPQFAYELVLHSNREGRGEPLYRTEEIVPHARQLTLDPKLLKGRAGEVFVRFRGRDIFDRNSSWKVAKLAATP